VERVMKVYKRLSLCREEGGYGGEDERKGVQ
jgi:hypothetical protein